MQFYVISPLKVFRLNWSIMDSIFCLFKNCISKLSHFDLKLSLKKD